MGNHSSGTAPPPGRCHRPRRRRTWRVPTRRTCGHTTSGRHRPRRGPPVPHTCQCTRTHTCMHTRHTNTHTCTQETVNLETEVVGDGASEAGDTVDEHPIAPPPPDVELHVPNLDELGDDELDVRARPCCPARPRPTPHNETHPPHATSSQWAVCGGWSDSTTCTQLHDPFLNTFHAQLIYGVQRPRSSVPQDDVWWWSWERTTAARPWAGPRGWSEAPHTGLRLGMLPMRMGEQPVVWVENPHIVQHYPPEPTP